MDELGQVLMQILRWAQAAAIIGGIGVVLMILARSGVPAKTVDAAASTEQTEAALPPVIPPLPKPSPVVELPMPVANEAQASPGAPIAPTEAVTSAAPLDNARPRETFKTSEVVYVGASCAEVEPGGARAPKKHRWPRRLFGAIGHGFKAIGRGIGKVGKTLVGR